MDAAYWNSLLADYRNASQQAFGRLVSDNALLLAMSVAQHETANGLAWPGTYNFGAVQLRKLTADEQSQFNADTLKAGDKFPGNPGGVLHVDTHPTSAGSIPYAVWFAAFPTRVDGIAYFLKVLWRCSKAAPEADGATAATVAQAMYASPPDAGGYYEGWKPGARPPSQRTQPLTAPELGNISDYAGAVDKCLAMINAVLVPATVTYQLSDDAPMPHVDPGGANV